MVGIEEEQQLNRNGLKRGLKLTRIPRSQKTNHFSANCTIFPQTVQPCRNLREINKALAAEGLAF